jgi:hypothetical protein
MPADKIPCNVFCRRIKEALEYAVLATITKTLNCVRKPSSGVDPGTQHLIRVKVFSYIDEG